MSDLNNHLHIKFYRARGRESLTSIESCAAPRFGDHVQLSGRTFRVTDVTWCIQEGHHLHNVVVLVYLGEGK